MNEPNAPTPAPDNDRKKNWYDWLFNISTKQWLLWGVNLVIAIVAGMLLIPWARVFPEDFHRFVVEKDSVVRWTIRFGVGLGVTWLLFRFFSVKVTQIGSLIWLKFPPLWLAWCFALAFLWGYDLTYGLGPRGGEMDFWEWAAEGFPRDSEKATYQASWEDWLVVALLPVGLFFAGQYLFPKNPEEAESDLLPIQLPIDELLKDWDRVESWLKSEDPAQYDILGYVRIADRMAERMLNDHGTFGLIGDYGSGKTTLIQWTKAKVREKQKNQKSSPKIWFVKQSCWGFEDSSTAIHQLLSAAVDEIGKHVDCFSFRFLPESYRKTFSGGDDWVHSILDMVLGCTDPIEQFHHLKAILECAHARVIFIIEDLDRNDSDRFDRQDILALLQRLREFKKQFSFVLATGKERSNDIDFAKLCDHFQLLPELTKEQMGKLISRVRRQCLDEYKVISPENEKTCWYLDPSDLKSHELDFLTPVSRLIRTPRVLKRALRHAYHAWEHLHGEVSLDVLLAVNMIRYGVPDLFDFLLRFHSELLSDEAERTFMKLSDVEMFPRLKLPWEDLTQRNGAMLPNLIEMLSVIMPSSIKNLGVEQSGWRSIPQGIESSKYWMRIVNEFVEGEQIKDEDFLRDFGDWIDNPKDEMMFVDRLQSSQQYYSLFQYFSKWIFRNREDCIFELFAQVIVRYRQEVEDQITNNTIVSKKIFPSRVIDDLARLIEQSELSGNKIEEFYTKQLQLAAKIQIDLVNQLYHYVLRLPVNRINPDFKPMVTQKSAEFMHDGFKTSKEPYQLFYTSHHNSLYDLIRLGKDKDLDWSWIGLYLIRCLQSKQMPIVGRIVMMNVFNLIIRRFPDGSLAVDEVDLSCLKKYFPGNESKLLDLIDLSVLGYSSQLANTIQKGINAARSELAKKSGDNSPQPPTGS
ncbi:P-loop NTPase fold protein [Tuwongella immobilis]|uniref:KAP NTPase domain-containing protein n=1 Tax=Tuwongella immobilis TaxID=692036 RepID=A0A6C2YKC3_9BACT|nr:P-loop NTPase fold protein [Tuwongella immobilis]VIP01372.1 Uncharacterized protein OS=Desulfatibacillum alkenivorans (strain AK-01) GN=Dalk_4687 PE=4 SV=1: NACHT [Tuwongella immobilis]VTR98209.1 Uncharacterized protein OS=Desulfatibacillum alkenivorans (strain AK-01) GN=Dalk_4687 PE=4 SV=1: NACHT [Tuwongella immobilis]